MQHAHPQHGTSGAQQAHDPSSIEASSERAACNPVLRVPVGGFLHGVQITAADHELENHIIDCVVLQERAYARFLAHQGHHDRDEAVEWLHRMHEATGRRRAEVVQALHAVVRQRIEGRSS